MSLSSRKNKRNYYRVLFVQPDAPMAVIQASYRAIMQKLKFHPDLGGDDWNAAVINEAFSVLSNPARREAYDRKLFKRSSRKRLSVQTADQRDGSFESTWQEFRPIRV